MGLTVQSESAIVINMEIIATIDPKSGMKIKGLSISVGDQKIVLDRDGCKTLMDVLEGKRGEISKFHGKEDYMPFEVIRFSCEKRFSCSTYEEDSQT